MAQHLAPGGAAPAHPLAQALQAGLQAAPPDPQQLAAPGTVLVLGGGGPLGSAVLEAAVAQRAAGHAARLGQRRHGQPAPPVATLVRRPLAVALSGLAAWQIADGGASADDSLWQAAPPMHWQADSALLVFDRERGSRHGREAAFVRPLPQQLPAIGRWLRMLGVRRLVLLTPVAPGLLPQAVRQGLASLDEQALAALGFDQLVLVRPAALPGSAPTSGPSAGSGGSWGQRLGQRMGGALLSQLGWMLPQREQPLRSAVVARFASELVQALPAAGGGTRVVAPELLWDWAQPGGGAPLLRAWLQGQPLPEVARPRQRW